MDRKSTPLKPSGDEPKFTGKPPDKFSAVEGDNVFMFIPVSGDPPPKVEWFKVCKISYGEKISQFQIYFVKGFKELSQEPRAKQWTDAASSCAILGMERTKQEDEGAYRCVLTSEKGTVEHEFSVYITGMFNSFY